MATRLPFEIREAVVQVCGKTFWLKDPLKSLLRIYGDRLIAADFDRKHRTVKKSFKVFVVSGMSLRLEKVGPLAAEKDSP